MNLFSFLDIWYLCMFVAYRDVLCRGRVGFLTAHSFMRAPEVTLGCGDPSVHGTFLRRFTDCQTLVPSFVFLVVEELQNLLVTLAFRDQDESCGFFD